MFKETDKQFSYETEILKKGAYVRRLASNPEAIPVYMTTAFNVEDLKELNDRYEAKGFCYNRNHNPNRTSLIELITYLEGGADSVITSSGMAAISTTLIALLKQGDHVLSDRTLYGETIDLMSKVLTGYGVSVTFVDFTRPEEVKAAIRENTRLLYTETVSNPMITVVDIKALAEISHEAGAVLVVDNTFMTSVAVRHNCEQPESDKVFVHREI